ncbi:serine/threonine protein phosphatase [Plantactinospora sp. BC1]|uniref:serine/threonine protein phosphatase n=1 Tax=Plantactinospora sp. BC1 TaxID=2108470 RepID=UPI000D159E69|nr:serine/threonine protein phosphatase [Plantactinospora sp. BC1]AVT34153.1 serine/threonine protein phosphatase [Plantactinospora sp. BC1]
MLAVRGFHHDRVSVALAARPDAELAALLDTAPLVAVGVGGGAAILDVDGVPVFVKRIPITDRELAHPHSTANLFDLPTYCQYGIGGPSPNVWRELAANLVVTEAVLAGEVESFPLLYHWRVLPGRPPTAAEHLDVDAVLGRVGGAAAVRTRLGELAGATSSLVLFLEHIPHPLPGWLNDDPVGRAGTTERQLAEVTAFLRDRELLHMDGHFGNLRSDGERIYLVDFGLAISPRFDLSDAERDFVARHADHDAGYAAMTLANWLVTRVCGVPTPASGGPVARNEYVRRCADGDIPPDVPGTVAGILARHTPAAARMNDFYWQLFGGDVHAEYPGPEAGSAAR